MLASDGSIADKHTLREIERSIVGEEPDLLVRFLEHAERDQKAEREQQRRIQQGSDEVARPFFRKTVFIERRHKGQKDYISRPAKESEKREYPREWAAFQEQQGKPPKHNISLLPGCDVLALAVFDELNISYIEDFLIFAEERPEIIEIFDELAPLLENAKRWRTFMKPRLKLVEGKAQ